VTRRAQAAFWVAAAFFYGGACRPPRALPATDPLPGFPVGVTRTVLLPEGFGAGGALAGREPLEQVRDWLLLVALRSSHAGPAGLGKLLEALPPLRLDLLDPVAGYPHGSMRAAKLSSSHAVLLVPAESERFRRDRLTEAADEIRLGPRTVAWLDVFEYSISPGGRVAHIKRLPAVRLGDLYGPGSGYVERMVRNAGDLGAFLNSIDDLSGAAIRGTGVLLRGRRLAPGPRRGATLEHVAGLYQGDKPAREVQKANRRLLDDFNRQWGSLTYSTEAEKSDFLRRREVALALVKQKMAAADAGVPNFVCGFSLDPYPPLTDKQLYQAARYDCDLGGTETGMSLFYGDLLGKLWAFDYLGSFPSHITGFLPLTRVQVSRAHLPELKALPRTRLWFGPRSGGFAASNDALTFGRTATRVFARSSAIDRAEELPPNAATAAFVGWWNDHYEEIASWEPEYQRLNQIVKWSLLFGWLDKHSALDRLGFLDSLPVNRANWFPEWARRRGAELRFQAWDRLQFYPRGSAGRQTETMAILRSEPFRQFGEGWVLSGGVSLGSPLDFEPGEPLPVPTYSHTDGPDPEVRVRPPGKSPMLGNNFELPSPEDIYWRYREGDAGLDITTGVGDIDLGGIRIQGGANELGVTLLRAAGNRAADLADHLGDATALGIEVFDAIAAYPGVETCIKLPGGGYAIQFGGQPRWLQLSPEPGGGGKAEAGGAKFTGSGENGRRFGVAWLSPDQVAGILKAAESVSVSSARGGSQGAKIEVSNRGPPADGKPVAVPTLHGAVRGFQSPSGELHFARGEIPDALLSDSRGLPSLLPASPVQDFLRAMSNGEFGVAADLLSSAPEELQPLVAQFRARELAAAGQAIADGRFDEANARLNVLTGTFPADAEARFYQAVARIAAGEAARVAGPGKAPITALRDPAPFLDLIGRVLANPATPELVRADVLRLAQFINAGKLAERRPEWDMLPVLGLNNGRVGYSVYLGGQAWRAAGRAATSPGDSVYFPSPFPYNLDWSPILGPSFSQLPGLGEAVRQLKLPPELRALDPSVVVDLSNGVSYWNGGPAHPMRPPNDGKSEKP
jgi:hypothetical protein